MKPTRQILPAPCILIPSNILYLLVLSRSRTRTTEFLRTNKDHIRTKKIQYRELFYPADAMSWKDRAQDTHLVILEESSDPVFFREEVGRIKLFFPSCLILKVSH